jgi:dTDP-4-dehydrorhamnose reductase
MRILIAGADGQLGRALPRELSHHEVTALGHAQLDIVDANSVRAALKAFHPNVIINAAAYNDVDGAEGHAELAAAINTHGPRNLAAEAAAARIPIVHVSTDYVFDGRAGRPYHEDDPANPLSAYARSKREGELAVMESNRRHFVVRTAWLFEANGKNFLNAMRRVSDRPEVRVVADQHGSPTYAPHLARAIARLIEGAAYGLYHMAGQGGTARDELVRYLYALLGKTTRIIPVGQDEFPAAAVRPRYTVLTTLRDAAMRLPPWQEGVSAFVADLVDSAPFDKSPGAAPTLDRTVLEKLRGQGGAALVAEIVAVYLSDLDRLVGQLRAAVAARDELRLRESAHALAGCSGGIGAVRLWHLSKDLSRTVVSHDLSGSEELLARLESEAPLVRHELLRESARG